MNNCKDIDQQELRNITRQDCEGGNLNAGATKCDGCCTLTEEPFTCAVCMEKFCGECCDGNFKGLDHIVCMNCRDDKDEMIQFLVDEIGGYNFNKMMIKFYEEKEQQDG